MVSQSQHAPQRLLTKSHSLPTDQLIAIVGRAWRCFGMEPPSLRTATLTRTLLFLTVAYQPADKASSFRLGAWACVFFMNSIKHDVANICLSTLLFREIERVPKRLRRTIYNLATSKYVSRRPKGRTGRHET